MQSDAGMVTEMDHVAVERFARAKASVVHVNHVERHIFERQWRARQLLCCSSPSMNARRLRVAMRVSRRRIPGMRIRARFVLVSEEVVGGAERVQGYLGCGPA